MNKNDEITRGAKLTLIIGTNGTGKTTLLKDILNFSHQKSLVITPDDAEWLDYEHVDLLQATDFLFSDIKRHIFDDNKKNGTLKRLEFFKKGSLVFDDCRAYLPSQTPPEIRDLIIRRRQREVDIFVVAHGFTEIPPVFFTFSTDIILFRTTDNIMKRKNCLKDFDKMLDAQIRVNNKAKENPYYKEVISFK